MKRIVIVGLAFAAGVFAQPPGPRGHGPGGPRGDFFPGPPGPPEEMVTGAPYTAQRVTTTQQTLSDGNVIQRQEQVSVFRDSQGRTRHEATIRTPDGQTSKRITISDPVAGMEHSLNPENKTAFSMHRPPRPARNGPAPRRPGPNRQNDPNVKQEDLGTQAVNGVAATGTRVTRTIPAGAIGNAQPIQSVHETWISTDLKVPVMVKRSDPRTGTTVTMLNNIVRAEPDAALFQVPSDYTLQRGPGMRGPGGPPRKQ